MTSVTNKALLRMRKACEKGKGVQLSAAEIQAFNIELLGQWWNAIDDEGNNTEESDFCRETRLNLAVDGNAERQPHAEREFGLTAALKKARADG